MYILLVKLDEIHILLLVSTGSINVYYISHDVYAKFYLEERLNRVAERGMANFPSIYYIQEI